MTRKHLLTRRGLLERAAACAAVAALPSVVPASVVGAAAPSGRVTLGCIGVGGRGMLNTNGLMHSRGGQVLAVCDVNGQRRGRAKATVQRYYAAGTDSGRYAGCEGYGDFRDLLARRDIDAVMIATPDHWHVPIAIAAVRAGKDIYVEKPLGMSIAQGQALRSAVRRHRAVFQHGTEQRAMGHFRRACELVRNGRIGKLHTVKVGAPGGRAGGPRRSAPVPADLDYEMWLGPAPKVPFTPAASLRQGHWFISDYAATGFVAGWGIHPLDIAHWGMGVDDTGPVEIVGHGDFPTDGLYDTATRWNIRFTYADGVKVHFTDSRQWPHGSDGVRFEGSEGWVFAGRSRGIDAEPKSLLRSVIGPEEIHLYDAGGSDDQNFIDCVKSRRETVCPFEAAHRSTSACMLGNIAMLLQRSLKWDPAAERFGDDEEANRMLTCAMRAPWHL